MGEHQAAAKRANDLEKLVNLANGSCPKTRHWKLDVAHMSLTLEVIIGTRATAETLVARTHVEVEHPIGVGHLPETIHELGLGHMDGRDATKHMGRKERTVNGANARRRRLEQG
jgi:hypothetical protein